jgi:hypothetical protein
MERTSGRWSLSLKENLEVEKLASMVIQIVAENSIAISYLISHIY